MIIVVDNSKNAKINRIVFNKELSTKKSTKLRNDYFHTATRIAGYCASSTECSDHSLQIRKKNFKLVLFSLRVVITGSEQKARN